MHYRFDVSFAIVRYNIFEIQIAYQTPVAILTKNKHSKK